MQLNEAQHAAVIHGQGPLLVLAGAGSGKTRVITYRIAHLLEQGVRAESILAVSFTNKATGELQERMSKLVGKQAAEALWLSTFHSFGVRFLSEEGPMAGHGERFVVVDQGDSMGLIRELLKKHWPGSADRKLDIGAVQARISLWKNAFLSPEQVPEPTFEYDEAALAVFGPYEETLRSMHGYDFDDLVLVPARLLSEHADLREKWQNRFRHILVDEFQDTSQSQLELTKLLMNPLKNLCVVGDDDQSIYGWRGAQVENIVGFDKMFPSAKVVMLETNYRSNQPILDVANAAIHQSTSKRHSKTLRAARRGGAPVRFCATQDTAEEAQLVGREIHELSQKGTPLTEIAVLYRSALQARLIEEELRQHQVPYKVFGGTQFYDRKEVKDAAAYLKCLVHPSDELSFRRIVNTPTRGVGLKSLERLSLWARTERLPLSSAAARADLPDTIPDASRRSLVALSHQLGEARRALKEGRALSETASMLFDKVGLKQALLDADGGSKKWGNVEFLLRSLRRYEDREDGRGDKKQSLAAFLQVFTMRNEKEDATGNWVSLSTLHAAKGLEYSVVFLIGCVEGQLPHSRSTDPKVTEASPSDVDEERRLFYVGVTRAKDLLYVTRPLRRSLRGRVIQLTPSRFLDGLPEAAIEHYERPDKQELGSTEVADMAKALLQNLAGG